MGAVLQASHVLRSRVINADEEDAEGSGVSIVEIELLQDLCCCQRVRKASDGGSLLVGCGFAGEGKKAASGAQRQVASPSCVWGWPRCRRWSNRSLVLKQINEQQQHFGDHLFKLWLRVHFAPLVLFQVHNTFSQCRFCSYVRS